MIDEKTVREFLHEHATDVDPTDASLDVDQAIRIGGHRHRRKTLLVGGAAALTVLALAGGTLAVRTTATDRTTAPASTSRPQTPAKRPLDPMVQLLSFSTWIPGGLPRYRQELSADGQRLTYSKLGAEPGGGQTEVQGMTAVLLPVGKSLTFGDFSTPGGAAADSDPRQGAPAQTVQGHRAYWVSRTPTSSTLAWEWTPGGWAGIYAHGYQAGSEAAIGAMLPHLSLTPGRVRLPFSVPRPPTALKLLSTSSSLNGDGTVDASLTFSDVPNATDPSTRILRSLSIYTQKSPSGNSYKGATANTTIDGHPAYLSTLDSEANPDLGASAIVFGVSGQMLAIDVNDLATARYVTAANVRTMIGAMRLTPHVSDPTSWFANPLT
jgi:hypothetical protein